MVDPIARAYAVIGVPRGASTRELKKQYRRLVRQWHPDRWHNDPVAQTEAADRLRAINDAYETLERLGPREPASPSRAHRALTREELDALVRAIGTESPVIGTVRVLMGLLPMAGAFLMLQPRRSGHFLLVPPSTSDVVMAAMFFAAGLAILRWNKRR